MKVNSLSEFELENDGFKIKLKRSIDDAEEEEVSAEESTGATPSSKGGKKTNAKDTASSTLIEVKAPMVGTFYLSPSPESAPYVERGSQVNPDTVICIVEAMKVMNEIKAEVRGTVVEIAATNGKPVEFGQTLFRIKPN